MKTPLQTHCSTSNRDISLRLDSLRGVSAIVVFLAHGYQLLILPVYPKHYAYAGLLAQAAVMMFFCLSGLLIGRSIQNNKLQNGEFQIEKYLRSRAVRIFPPLAFASILVLSLNHAAPLLFESGANAFLAINKAFMTRVNFSAPASDVLGSFFLMNGFFTNTFRANTPLWSLSIEAWYYAVAGLIFWRGSIGRLLAIGVFALGCYKNPVFMKLSVVWFSGLALSLLQAHLVRFGKLITLLGFAFYAAALFCGAIYAESFSKAASLKELNTSSLPYYSVFIGLAFAATLALVICGKLRFKPYLARCSKFSYTLYAIHFPIYLFMFGIFEKRITESPASAFTYTAAVSILILALAIPAASLLEGWMSHALSGRNKSNGNVRALAKGD